MITLYLLLLCYYPFIINGSHDCQVDNKYTQAASLTAGSCTPNFPSVKRLHWSLKRRILISGGAGFVGSHLTDRLMKEGHQVIVLDNFMTGKRQNIEHWIGHSNFEFVHHDITDPIQLEVDEIYHLASPASPKHYMVNPIRTIKANTLGTLNVLGLSRRTNAKFLFASTSEIYGDPEIHPQPETYWGNVNPIGPRACYDESKRLGEALCYAYYRHLNLSVRVARIFNTYGPRMQLNDGRVVSNFITQALSNDSITIYGSGEQTRSFQYISDLIDGLVLLMNSNYTLPVNLGNPVEFTVNQLAEMVKRITSSSSRIVHESANVDDPQRRQPNITLARKVLGWEPKIDITTGLLKSVGYFQRMINMPYSAIDTDDQ